MKILVTGGTGFIGKHLIQRRLDAGDEIICLSRSTEKVNSLFGGKVTGISELPKDGSLTVDAIINLAGEPIADKRWSDAQKHKLRDSRILLTLELVEWISGLDTKPHTFISGSAIGFYGTQGDHKLTEDSDFNAGFTHQLCADWEKAALQAEPFGVRVCLIRTGVVLGKNGGALSKMLLPFKLGLGGPIGNGEQIMSWVHLDDELEVIEMLLTHDHLSGVFNLTAPEAETNAVFTKTLGKVLKRPTCLPMPNFVPKLMLGEGAELLLEGQRVYPQKLLDVGYQFKHPTLRGALEDVLL